MRRWWLLLLPALTGCALPAARMTSAQAVATAESLPRLSYRLPVEPSRLVADERLIKALALEVERKTAALLASRPIDDAATRGELLAARCTAALALRNYEAALAVPGGSGEEARAGLATQLLIAALRVPTGAGNARAREAVRAVLAAQGPSKRPAILALRRELALASSAYRLGEIASFADPQWRRDPVVGQEFAVALLRLWTEINLRNPLLEPIEAELAAWLEAHPDPARNIWPERELSLDFSRERPVTVAIWDSVDRAALASNGMALPTAGTSGVRGLAYDEHFRPTEGHLLPIPASILPRMADLERYARGSGALAAGLDGPDVEFARAWRRRLTPADVEGFERGYGFYVNYIHGTQVAGIALRGLPRAQLVTVRITFSESVPPPPLNETAAARFAAMAAEAARFMRAQGARVCNISWGFTAADIENNLAQNAIGRNAEARARMAAKIYDIMYKGMERAIAGSPDILFVVSAGNAGQDVDFVRDLPGSINLPNVLTVGAADAEGRLASFASRGASVDLYALGTNVPTIVPGGGQRLASGASLAAPQVVNAAARLLSVRPDLSAAEIASLLKRTAGPVAGSNLPLLDASAAARMIAVKSKP